VLVALAGGVGISDAELADPEDADETDAERALPRAIGIGKEGLMVSGIEDDMVVGRKKGRSNVHSNLYNAGVETTISLISRGNLLTDRASPLGSPHDPFTPHSG